MVAKIILKTWLFILVLTFNSIFAATYYVDAGSGNDSNNGTSPNSAWKSLSKVNAVKYNPGDQILFKRGSTWTGSLVPSSSGTSSSRIIYGAYGEGNKPKITLIQAIPGSNESAKWIKYSSSVYYMKLPLELMSETRVWFGDKEYDWSTSGVGGINSTRRWTISNGNLYVYATSNPASFYSNVKYAGYRSSYLTLKLQDKDYLTFQNLDLSGGYNTVGLGGADYITIEDCNVGLGTHGRGVVGNSSSDLSASDNTSDYAVIRRCTFDSGWKVYTDQNREIMDAISIQNGASYWEIYDNTFINWDHSAVQIYGVTAPTNYNKVYRNKITAPDIAFARSFEILGRDPEWAKYNEIYRNYITDITVRAQIGGYYTKMYYNVFCDITNSTTIYGNGTTAEGINVATFGSGVSKGVKIYNNTFYGLDRTGLWSYVRNSEFVNNLVVDCGRKQSGYGIRTTNDGAYNGIWKNNMIYTPGLTSSNYIVVWNNKGATMSQFNAQNGSNGNVISNNMQHTGSLGALVKNAAACDFNLPSGSPAINKGIDVGLKEDFYGKPIVGNPDIGAIEYGSSTGTEQIAPKITSIGITSAQIGKAYAYDVNASGNPAPVYSLKVFPAGMTINSTSGLISWTPTIAGNHSIIVEASNGVNPAAQQSFTITVSSVTIPTVPAYPSGLISYWKLNETSGSIFKDEMGKNNAAGNVSPVPVSGQVSGAQQFNGSTTKLNVAANPAFDFGNKSNFSVEFWYKGSSAPSTVKAAVGRYIPSTGAKWWVGLNANDGKARFYMAAGGKSAAVNGSVIADGKWHHVTATRNGSTGSIKIYVDGALKASSAISPAIGFASASDNLNIGWFSFQSAYALNGALDEVAIYSKELSSTEIQQHYNNGVKGLNYFESILSTKNILTEVQLSAENTFNTLPSNFELKQNYPNPFNPATTIKYAVSEAANVTIKIYDMLGAEVMTLINKDHAPGYYEVNFNASNLSSGTYIYQLRSNGYVETKKMLLLK